MSTLALDFKEPLQEGATTVANFAPKLVGFLLILLVGYIIAKVVAKIVDKVLDRVGFDRAVERGGIKKALSKSRYDASDIVSKLVFFAIFIPVLSAAIGVLGIAALTAPLAAFIALIPKIIVAIVLVVLGAVIAGAVKKLIEDLLGGLSYGSLVATGASVLVLFGFVKAALDQVGVATAVTGPILVAFLATVVGVVVVGVGGGLIKPAQARWEKALAKGEDEAGKVKDEVKSSSEPAPAPVPVKAARTRRTRSVAPPTL